VQPNTPEAGVIDRVATEVAAVKKASDPPPMINSLPMVQKSVKDSMYKLEAMTATLIPKSATEKQDEPAKPKAKPTDEPGLPGRTLQTASNPTGAKTGAPKPGMGVRPPAAGKPTPKPGVVPPKR
jgi:hypothetical protein